MDPSRKRKNQGTEESSRQSSQDQTHPSIIEGDHYQEPKSLNQHNDDDDDAEGEDDIGWKNKEPATHKRPRLRWDAIMHKKFMDAVNLLGINKAVPSEILKIMNVDTLTREHIASHLQKYKKDVKNRSNENAPLNEPEKAQTTHQGRLQSAMLIQSSRSIISDHPLPSNPMPPAEFNQTLYNNFPRQKPPVPLPLPSSAPSYLPPTQVCPLPPASANEDETLFNLLTPMSLSYNEAREIMRAFVDKVGEDHHKLNEESFLTLEGNLHLPQRTCLYKLYQLYHNSLQVVLQNLITYFQCWQNDPILGPPVQSTSTLDTSPMPHAQVNDITFNTFPGNGCPVPSSTSGLFDLLPPPSLSFYEAREMVKEFVNWVGDTDSKLNQCSFLALRRNLRLSSWICLYEQYTLFHNSLQEILTNIMTYFQSSQIYPPVGTPVQSSSTLHSSQMQPAQVNENVYNGFLGQRHTGPPPAPSCLPPHNVRPVPPAAVAERDPLNDLRLPSLSDNTVKEILDALINSAGIDNPI